MGFFKKNTATKKFDGKKMEPVVPVKTDKAEAKVHGKMGGLNMSAKEVKLSHGVILHPLVTEKGAHLSTFNQYIFAVASNASKVKIRQSIFEMFGIYPKKINIVNQLSKKVIRGRIQGTKNRPTKAYVTMPKGVSLDVYSGV